MIANIVKFSPTARRQLQEIARYTEEQWGISQSEVYLGYLYSAFDLLRSNPKKGKSRGELSENLSSVHVKKHVVFYKFKTNIVNIVAILHERMDPRLHITPDS
jgi:toxin ParE1/3/4